jgi:hypothetical protein
LGGLVGDKQNRSQKMKKQFLSFQKARKFVRTLDLKGVEEWRRYTKTKDFQKQNIPTTPETTYKNEGWTGYGDWLGTGRIANFNMKYRSFLESRKFTRSLNLKKGKEWYEFCKSGNKPVDIPTAPNKAYKKDWKGMGDWLGTGVISSHNRQYKSFIDARTFVHSLKLKNGNDWKEFCKSGNKPDDIPNTPRSVYKKDWKNLSDWLGISFVSNTNRVFLSFIDARTFVHTLGIKSDSKWRKYAKTTKRPQNIPANPRRTYQNEFINMPDWLGTGRIPEKDRVYQEFSKARNFVHTLDLKGVEAWRKFTKTNDFQKEHLPVTPEKHYEGKGWNGYGDFLGTGNIATQEKKSIPYMDAKKIIQNWDFTKTQVGWNKYVRTHKIPLDIPKAPVAVYGVDWISWGDWLGTGSLSSTEKSKQYLPWKESKILYRKIGKENNLKSLADWKRYIKNHKLPKVLPPEPWKIYTKERVWEKMQE